MVEPQAQLACFGAIDEALPQCSPGTVRMVEEQLPGVTRPGRRGWYGELQRFLTRNEDALRPLDQDRPASVTLPDFTDAVAMVFDEPRERVLGTEPVAVRAPTAQDLIEDCASNASSLIRASTVINKIVEAENGTHVFGEKAADALLFDGNVDPLAVVVNHATALPEDRSVEIASKLRATTCRAEVDQTLREMVNEDPDTVSLRIEDHYTARLRNLKGRWSSILSSDWQRPELTLEQFKRFIEPRNWHLLYDFFSAMEWNRPQTSNGWTRILEVVSPDPLDRWMLKTTLRYWKTDTRDGGICINYDLAELRDPHDSRLVEVDNGYIWITNLDREDPDAGVRVRASKELRIRGLSPTATAALGIYTGWPDAAAQLLTAKAASPPDGCIEFGPVSPTEEPAHAGPHGAADTSDTDELGQPTAPTEAPDLPPGWREALLDNAQTQALEFSKTVSGLTKHTVNKWSDGIKPSDIVDIGTDWGTTLTDFAVSSFEQAVNTVRPPSKESP
ncbi:hypothetical protein [Mycobacterium sp. ACS4331]|uniref:hypothetical protein n=1 Tax=Mycobacterium sp. ACS4331 TaxID=1834121 RepID=UPI0007FCB1B5|nr:hypothetical protein [Mycobacterium sp. ACS4331]OBF16149.1 hypothetical protein A5727_14430 [Mycobacterium sp. ACS4331]